jgi:60 kDa SS-A/Ro ribonucleoprotein
MTRYGEIANDRATPQTEQARADQVMNNAGGFVFAAGPWTQLDRFLILGQVGNTYYATERKIVKENADVIRTCLALDGARVVRRIVEISDSGRAPKNDPAIYALAVAVADKNEATRKEALAAIPRVCRIGTHLFNFAADAKGFRGLGGSGFMRAIGRWYTGREDKELAMQALKYQSRNGWSHGDLLRLTHPRAKNPTMDATFRWMLAGSEGLEKTRKHGGPVLRSTLHPLLAAYDELHAAKENPKEAVKIITTHELPREAVPTELLNDPDIWAALLPHMGITAVIRNLGKMTAVGLLKPMSSYSKLVVEKLTSNELLRKGRVHPMQLLVALGIYKQGHGEKGSLTWQPVREILDALDAAFYLAFEFVVPTGKNTLLALDVSGSMDGGAIAGAPGITPRVAAAAMAMVTARAEQHWHMVGFTSSASSGRWGWGQGNALTPIDVSKNERLDSICNKARALPMGGTDCALPMLYATKEKLEIDTFVIYTDCETYAGTPHPFQALKDYRKASGRNARLVVQAFTASNFTIADPSDAGMLDVVGMDSHAPALISAFARGEV